MSQRTISSPPFYNYDYLTQDAADNNTNLHYAFNSKIMVAAIIVLFLVMLFIVMLHLYTKWFLHNSSRSIIITRRGISMASAAAVQPSINTGLDAAVLAELPTFIFKASSTDDSQAGTKHESMEAPLLECAVCLSEFQENEKGRLLPSCKHTFHTECIDMWFSSHSTCPLCRTVVFASTAASPAEEQHRGEGQQVIPMETSSANAQSTTTHVPSNAVQFPCNVLFWGNEAQVASTQEPSSSNATPLPASRMRPLPQITIDIPPIEGGVLLTVSTPGRRSSRSTCGHSIDQAACSSQPLKSPGLRASLKRMLSRQSSRHAEGNELGSPK